MIKAIETEFKGYKFRSRLEARWAVFFDVLMVPFEYEREGFDVNGQWYLPDFWIPEPECRPDDYPTGSWVEIKPSPLDDGQIQLLSDLAKISGDFVYAFCGQPWPGEYQIYHFIPSYCGFIPNNPIYRNGELFEVDRITETDRLACEEDEYINPYYQLSLVSEVGTHYGLEEYGFAPNWKPGLLKKAYKTARSARFEHGETPSL